MRNFWAKPALLAFFAHSVFSDPITVDIQVNIDLDRQDDNLVRKGGPRADATISASEEPTVNLGYEIHQASPDSVNHQGFWNFSNIPFAQPPVGNLRFKKAKPLSSKIYPELNRGDVGARCPQIQMGWGLQSAEFLGNFYDPAQPPLDEKWEQEIFPEDYAPLERSNLGNLSVWMNEDCLKLDVMVPKNVWNNRNDILRPVMVWIYGGGFVFGWKELMGSPAGLFEASGLNPDDEFIFVALNYRLGAFGWLAGDEFEDNGGFENAGLSDQLEALRWVKKHIHKFGGNATRVTVIGESAGGASILHHITSEGGKGDPPPFQQAVLQSPGFIPVVDRTYMDDIYSEFLSEAGAKNFADLQSKDADDLIWANMYTTYYSPYGRFAYGPVVDDTYVPDLPGRLLKNESFHSDIKIMAGYNRDEGILFTPPWIRSREDLREQLLKVWPEFDQLSLNILIGFLYPIPYNSLPRTRVGVVTDVLGDIAINCSPYFLRKAKKDDIYYYRFFVLPGFHGQDTDYTFYNSTNPAFPFLEVVEKQARTLQRFITSFVNTGIPTSTEGEQFDLYSQAQQILTFGKLFINDEKKIDWANVVEMMDDPISPIKCDFWQNAPYAGNTESGSGLTVQGEL